MPQWTGNLQPFVGYSFLCDDQQSNVWDNIEGQKDDLEQSEERVNNHVKGFSWNGKSFTLHVVYQIRGHYAH